MPQQIRKKTRSLFFVVAVLTQFGSTKPMLTNTCQGTFAETKLTDIPLDCLCEILQFVDNEMKSSCTLRLACRMFEKAVRKRFLNFKVDGSKNRIELYGIKLWRKGVKLSKLKPFGKLKKFSIEQMPNCDNLLAREMEDLQNVTDLVVNNCKDFTGSGLQNLPNLQELAVYYCGKFNKMMLKNPKKLRKLEVLNSSELTDTALEGLQGLCFLHLSYCDEFTGDVLEGIKSLKEFWVSFCSKFTGKGLKNLVHLCKLQVGECGQFTGEGMENLTNLCELMVAYCENFTEEGLENLINLRKLGVDFSDKFQICDQTIEKLKNQGCEVKIVSF